MNIHGLCFAVKISFILRNYLSLAVKSLRPKLYQEFTVNSRRTLSQKGAISQKMNRSKSKNKNQKTACPDTPVNHSLSEPQVPPIGNELPISVDSVGKSLQQGKKKRKIKKSRKERSESSNSQGEDRQSEEGSGLTALHHEQS